MITCYHRLCYNIKRQLSRHHTNSMSRTTYYYELKKKNFMDVKNTIIKWIDVLKTFYIQ